MEYCKRAVTHVHYIKELISNENYLKATVFELTNYVYMVDQNPFQKHSNS